MKDIDRLIDFLSFSNKFREISRTIYLKDHPHPENDAEHSFQLALAAWYIISAKGLPLDLNKVIQYALAHDLVEIYAGDTYFFAEQKEIDSKKEREESAAKRIKEEFPEFRELHEIIEEYEHRKTPESRFVYALDKIVPIINIYLDDGAGFKERRVTLDILLQSKTPKVSFDPVIKKYFDELMTLLNKEGGKIFTLK